MSKLRSFALWTLTLAVVLAFAVCVTAPVAKAAEATDVATDTTLITGDGTAVDAVQPEPTVKQGLVTENGNTYFYNEDGTLFTGGYKEVTVEGITKYYFFQEDGTAFTGGYKVITRGDKRVYYYFQEDGTAYTGGYLHFVVAEKDYYFFFQEDGTAFTGGYKEIVIDGTTRYFYFLSNGQGYNTGYKTAEIDGKKYYFYFGDDAQALTNTLQTIPLGERTAYMLFKEDGKAFTGGLKEIAGQDTTDYYYFLGNGQAFTTGYKTVTVGDVTDFYYFEDNGKAFTGGLKSIPFGELSYYYYFGADGKGTTSAWENAEGKDYYFQANGRAAQDTFVTIDGSIYHFDGNCSLSTGGWFSAGDGCYFADEKGALATNTMIDNYVLDAKGKSAVRYKIISYVNKHTKSTMTDQEKIEALYNWILKSDMIYIRTYEHAKPDWVWKESWPNDMVERHLNKWGGNCFSYAALLGFLVREATGLQVTAYHGDTPGSAAPLVPHGWITVMQDGQQYVYDVELDKFTKYATSKCYKVLATESKLHLNGVGSNLY